MVRRPSRRPIEDGYFTIPDDPAEPPRLLGSRCPACGEVFFPRRHRVRPVPRTRAATTCCSARAAALHLDVRPRPAVRQEGRQGRAPTASARSTCPRARGCRRSSSAAPTTSTSAWSSSSTSRPSARTTDGDEVVIFRFRAGRVRTSTPAGGAGREDRGRGRRGRRDGAVRRVPRPQRPPTWPATRASRRCTTPA